jgi:hypothetical protein
MRRLVLVTTLVTAVVLAAATPALGSRPSVELCRGEAWKTVGTTNSKVFRNVGDCVAYSERGGTLVPLLQAVADERCILDPVDPPSSACITVTGFGLEPGSDVVVTLAIEGEPLVFVATGDADGEVFFETATGCLPGTDEIVLSLSATGMTATGVALSTPPNTFSIFCTRG